MNYVNELQDLGIDLRNRSAGQIKTRCPKCSHERKRKMILVYLLILQMGILIAIIVAGMDQ
ncbi:MAG: hypothetical protein CM15mV120_080 [uncultured marine virus]|nr:MAG: hypothetical protein CM15mV120_080 [uncultured marine virus]